MATFTGVHSYRTRDGSLLWFWQAQVRGILRKERGFDEARDASEARTAWMAEMNAGGSRGGGSMLYGDFVQREWLPRRRAKVARGELRSSTLAENERVVRNHLLPGFGKRRLRDIRVDDVERFADRLTGRGLSNDTVLRAVNTLGSTLKLAVRNRYVPYNPVRDAEKPRPSRRQPDLPTLEEVDRLAAAMPSAETRAIVLFAALTGTRKSESFALRWPNVDLVKGDERARIVEQHYKGETVPSPKTAAGRREVLLGPRIAAVLRELSVGQQLDGRPNPHGLVFPSPTGERWLDTNFDRRVWKRARDEAGLPGLTFHTLRYFFVSHLRAQGLPTSLSAPLVGHADERTHVGYTRPIAATEPLIRAALAAVEAAE